MYMTIGHSGLEKVACVSFLANTIITSVLKQLSVSSNKKATWLVGWFVALVLQVWDERHGLVELQDQTGLHAFVGRSALD